jgi:hypothetical protein
MRTLLAATAVLLLAGTAPGFARDYPWCARTSANGFNGDCSYTSFQQCRATVSGQAGECRINPLFAFGQQTRRRYRSYAY